MKGRNMKLLVSAILALLLTTATGKANEPPPVPEGGINYYLEGHCRDHESGQEGYCYMGNTTDGRTLMMFWQGQELMFIRKVVGDGYETIWVNPKFNSL